MDINTIIFSFHNVISPDNSEVVYSNFSNAMKDSNLKNRILASPKLYKCLRGKIPFEEYKHEIGKLANIDPESTNKFVNTLLDTRLANKEVIEIIKQLKANNFTLALYTDEMKVPFDFWTRKFGLRELFEFQICSAYLGSLKNDISSWERVLKHIGKKAKRCLVIDSSQSNLYTANLVGCETIHFTSVEYLKSKLEDYKIILN